MKFSFIITIFFFLPISLFSNDLTYHIQSNKKIYSLSNKWRFIASDNINFKNINIDTSHWESLSPDKTWNNISYLRNYKGNGWYRLNLLITKDFNDAAILIYFHYSGAQIYINGLQIFESRKFSSGGISPAKSGRPDYIQIPSSLLKKGNNAIAIRTGRQEDGGFLGNILLGPSELIKAKWVKFIIWYSILTSVCIFLSFYFFILFTKRKKDTFYLFFSILSGGIGVWILGLKGIILWFLDYQMAYYLCTYLGAFIVPVMTLNFLHSFLNQKKFLITTIFEIIYCFFIFLFLSNIIFFGNINFFKKFIFKPFMFTTFSLIIYGIYICLIGIKNKNQYSKQIFTGISILGVSTIFTIFQYTGIITLFDITIESFFIMIIIFSIILAARYANVFTDLESAHSELLVLDKMKDDFLATTTHELRTPLHGIIGLTEVLADGSQGAITVRQLESLHLINASATRLNGLVSSILDFSKLRAGRADLFIEPVSIEDIIKSVVSLLKPTAGEKQIEFKIEIGTIPTIKADRNRIFQVLVNLVGNAIKFTEKGSIIVRASAESNRVRVEVIDTGTGIDKKDLERIWNPFVQGGDADTRGSVGTGLGLAITKYLVELHGGTISAVSEPGNGSTFAFVLSVEPVVTGIAVSRGKARTLELPSGDILPAAFSSVVAETGPEYQAPVHVTKAKYSFAVILAVDDDPVNLKVMENLCAAASYRLLTAATGPAALEIVEQEEIDLVLLDLMLPGMSGFEVCQRLRASERGRALPVIMVTARDQLGDLLRGFETGANDYITKPFKRQELLMRIENQLAIKQLLVMEKSVINGLRKEKDAITNLFQRSTDLRESTLQMLEWENIIREDLGIAHAFQMKLMTHQTGISGIDSCVAYHPLMEVGGDLYDIFELRPGVTRVFLADATGHGITASLNTVKILSEYAAIKEGIGTPAGIVNFLNQRFTRGFADYNIVFTCVIADIYRDESKLVMACAGHPPQFMLHDGTAAGIRPYGPIIGLSASVTYEDESYDFTPGDLFFMYTDGLPDMIRSFQGGDRGYEIDDMEILGKAVEELYAGADLGSACEALFKRYRGTKRYIDDDVTFIAIRRE